MRWGRSIVDSYAAMRRRLIRETEVALLAGLTSQHHPSIPTIEVGKGRFPADFSSRFWEELLDISDNERAALLLTFGERDEPVYVIDAAQ